MFLRIKVIIQTFALFGVFACLVIALRVFDTSAAFQIQNLIQFKKIEDRHNISIPASSKPSPVIKANVYRSSAESGNFTRAKLKYNGGSALMYVFDKSDLISRTIIETGSWEIGAIALMERYFIKHQDVHLIDIGCNLGVYTLVAALLGRKVVAVDANIEVIRRLRKSVMENKLDNLVTIVHNGVSNVYSNLTLFVADPKNIGGSGVVHPRSHIKDAEYIQTINMDDLLEIIDFKKAILKIDIEGHEYEALQKSRKLFQQIDIHIVIFEWGGKGKSGNIALAEFYLQLFQSRGYKPYTALIGGSLLDPAKYTDWPWDMYWRKY